MKKKGRIIVALDGLNGDQIIKTAKMFKGHPEIVFKVNDGLDEPGLQILTDLLDYGETFADAKTKDTPKTMRNRVTKITKRSPRFITIDSNNSLAALKAAVEAREEADILAVTVLTSIKEKECQFLYGCSINAAVPKFARHALAAGVQGIVCSAAELKLLSEYPELSGLIKVTPAIRPIWYQDLVKKPDDQDKDRTMTPAEAFKLGADCLVMGRPLLEAPGRTPIEALEATIAEIERS